MEKCSLKKKVYIQ